MKVLTTIKQGPMDSLRIKTKLKWYKRFWYCVSNPFTYIFLGYIRY